MFQSMTLGQFLQQGGYVLLFLSICSVVSITVIIERFFVLFTFKRKANKLASAVLHKLKRGKVDDALEICEKEPSLVGKMFLSALERQGSAKDRLEEAMQRSGIKLTMSLERHLSILATLGSTTPFIGLFGTVIGIIKTFHSLSLTDAYSSNLVSNGIAEALINTAAGLFVAIPAVIAYNYFARRILLIIRELEIAGSETIELLTESARV